MTKKITDINGVEIEVGDLVVSSTVTSYGNMKVGIVSHIGEALYNWQDPTITVSYTYERNKYAYEIGAPKLEEKYQDWGKHEYEPGKWTYGYHGETKTRMVNDRRVVGKTTDIGKQVRQRSCNILVVRKKDGTTPAQFTAAIDNHTLLYPNSENASE